MPDQHQGPSASSKARRDRPIDPKLVRRAKALAEGYQVRVERNSRGFVGTVIDLPTVFGVGASEAAALADARRHLKWALAYLLAAGRAPSRAKRQRPA